MKLTESKLLLIFLFGVVIVFFYKTIFFGLIPFPGDLLVNNAPYKTESYIGYAPGGYPNKAQGPDVITETYPWKYFAISQLKHGQIPFWNPHNFSGNLQMQNYQTAAFYPLNILFFILPFNIAWALLIISQAVLALIFMYIFLRGEKLKLVSCFLGSIAFAFSSYMVVWLEYGNISSTILWLPLVLFLIKRFIQTKQLRYFIFLILSFTTAFLAGYIQGVFYIYIVAFFYTLLQLRLQKQNIFSSFNIFLLLTFLLPILLSCEQLVPSFEFFNNSTRNAYSLQQIESLLQPIYYFVTIFAPDFFGNPASRNFWFNGTYIERVMYGGIPVTFFAFLALIKVKKIEKSFFVILGVIFLLLTTNLPYIKYFYLIPIPVISTTVPTRALSIFIFCMVVLAAYGIDHWLTSKEKKSTIPFLFLGIYAVVWVTVLVLPKLYPSVLTNFSITKHNLILPTLLAIGTVVVFYTKNKLRTIGICLLFFLVLFDLFYFFIKITPFSPQQLMYPKTPVVSYLQQNAGIYRFWGYGSAYIPSNFQSVDGTYSPEGTDPLHLKHYGLLLATTVNGQYPRILPRLDANVAPGFGPDDLRDNQYRQKVLNLLGVKYILHTDEGLDSPFKPNYGVFPGENYKLVWQQKPWQIYENKKVLPRYFLTTDYLVVPNDKEAIKTLFKPSTDITKTLLLNQPVQTTKGATGKVTLLSYQPNSVSFMTQTNGNMLLFLSDNYYHSWKAKIDNNESAVYKTDVAFKSVKVPQGKHVVTFFYNAQYFTLGLIISGFGLVCFIGSILYIKKYVKKK